MSLAKAIYRQCPYCEGSGKILGEPQTWKLIKYGIIEELSKGENIEAIDVLVHSEIRSYLEKEVLTDLKMISTRFKVKLNFIGRPDYHHEQFSFVTHVKSAESDDKPSIIRKRRTTFEKKGIKSLNPPNAAG
ncbi:hypothetical protein HY256_08540 [Candidatus Sumerlaeota bacterium]|nr:hypothetical protein [Candidatus Sumerlaeota bacterium]